MLVDRERAEIIKEVFGETKPFDAIISTSSGLFLNLAFGEVSLLVSWLVV